VLYQVREKCLCLRPDHVQSITKLNVLQLPNRQGAAADQRQQSACLTAFLSGIHSREDHHRILGLPPLHAIASQAERLAQPHSSSFPAIKRRPYIQVKAQVTGVLRRESTTCSRARGRCRTATSVEIYDVADFLAASGDYPVMPIERRSVAVLGVRRKKRLLMNT
jgi:hypothetical protein